MTNANAMGIIFPNLHSTNVPELVAHRTMASVPFAGRNRMIDFCLSGMAGAGMQNIAVITTKNYQSLMDHLGSGREWDLSSKRGGLVLFPPYGRDGSDVYSGRIEAMASILEYLEARRESLVVMSDCDIAFNLDYVELLAVHRKSGADMTVVYEKAPIWEGMQKDNITLTLGEDGHVVEVRQNEYKKGTQNLCMNVFVVGREYLINVVRECMVRGEKNFINDFLAKVLEQIRVVGYEFCGYSAHIFSMQSYFKESLRLIEWDNLEGLFPTERPVYTKVRDEAPVRYAVGSSARRCVVADGCIIEGAIENCMLFRGVRIGKNTKLKNCVIMQGTVVEEDVEMENVITDKNVRISRGQRLRGAASFPVFIAKNCTVV